VPKIQLNASVFTAFITGFEVARIPGASTKESPSFVTVGTFC
jgi:hypothetical protein